MMNKKEEAARKLWEDGRCHWADEPNAFAEGSAKHQSLVYDLLQEDLARGLELAREHLEEGAWWLRSAVRLYEKV